MYDFQDQGGPQAAVKQPPPPRAATPPQRHQDAARRARAAGGPSIVDAPALACIDCRREICQGGYRKGDKVGQPAAVYCQAFGWPIEDRHAVHYCLMSWPKDADGNGGGDDL